MDRNALFDVLKLALWGRGAAAADEEIYREMKAHSIHTLAAPVLRELSLPPELTAKWKSDVIRQVMCYHAYLNAQQTLPLTVPYVVVKGTSAAKYYPFPEYRAMGDIDLITRQEDYDAACRMMLDAGYEEELDETALELGRHRMFVRNGFLVEIHIFYASMNDPDTCRRFDHLIMGHIDETHVLPDLLNGLTLLEHISQHMENGLGLRQIIDWMMFVNACLDDAAWPEFEANVREFGLRKLAVTVTRMCEMYLGLRERAWSREADERLCTSLMDYIFACGDFGGKIQRPESLSVGRAHKLRHPAAALRELQQRGVENWPKAKKLYLRPFAWLWQGCRFFRETSDLTGGYLTARQQDRMFDALGVRREAKGLVWYRNGEYVKRQRR